MAHALGARVTLITTLSPGFDRSVLEGLELLATPASCMPRYANSYDAAGNRRQLLLARGAPLEIDARQLETEPDVLLVAPAYHELRAAPAIPSRYVGTDLQGPLRAISGTTVRSHPNPALVARRFIKPGTFAFFSEEDTPAANTLAEDITAGGATAIVTRGYRGATLFRESARRDLRPIPARPVDPTGAGDCFATAFMVRLAETGDIEAACSFGLAAGALAVEGTGLRGIPTRDQVLERLASEAA